MNAAARASLLKSFSFFAVSDFAPTREELWDHRVAAANVVSRDTWEETIEAISAPASVAALGLRHEDGFFSASAMGAQERRQRYRIALRKMKRAEQFARCVRFLPTVRAVLLCNTLGWWNVRETSDIDLLLIVAAGRLFATRLVIVAILRLFRLRPSEGSRDPLCCSFWLSDANFNLQSIAFPDDLYLSFWLRRLIPVYDPHGLHKKLLSANAELLSRFAHVNDLAIAPLVKRSSLLERCLATIPAALLWFIPEAWALALSRRLFFGAVSGRDSRGTGVVMNEQMIKLHVNDRREEIRDAASAWIERFA